MKRRDVLRGAAVAAGVVVVGLPAEVAGAERIRREYDPAWLNKANPWLSCFHVDHIPTTLPANMEARYDKAKDILVWYLGDGGENIFQLSTLEQVSVPRVSCSDAVLESAAGALLLCAAEYTKYDFMHGSTARDKPRIINGPSQGVVGTPGRIDSVKLSVGDPDFVGYLALYPDGTRGLVLMNSHAVLKL